MSGRGVLIALSGVDCAGKSTQRAHLLDALRSWRRTPVTIWTRVGYTPGLETAKRALRALLGRTKPGRSGTSERPGRYPRRATDMGSALQRWTWLTAGLLEILWIFAVRVRVSRALGRVVVCDRYLPDCLVDLRVYFPAERAEERLLGRLLRRLSPRPDVALCLMVPAEQTLARARAKSRFHWETLEVLRLRCGEYEAVSRELGIPLIDGERPAVEIARSLRSRLAGVLAVDERFPAQVHEIGPASPVPRTR